MRLKIGINLKLFSVSSFLLTGSAVVFARDNVEVWTILGLYFATLLNLFFLVYGVKEVFDLGLGEKKDNKLLIFLLFSGKLIILFLGIAMGVHFMGNRIIIPVLNYVAQIFALSISMHKHIKVMK